MENKQATLELGTKPVGKLLVQYALPAMIAMTAGFVPNSNVACLFSHIYNKVSDIFCTFADK
jgi:hypothetical protein